MQFNVGIDDVSLAQTGEQGFPVHVNPESVLYPNTVEKYNFGMQFNVGIDDVSLLQQKEKSNWVDEALYNNQPAPYCSSAGWCGRPYGNKAPAPIDMPRIGAYDAEGAWVISQNITNSTGIISAPGDQESVPCIKGVDTNVVRCL
jgi:hypothetical protein